MPLTHDTAGTSPQPQPFNRQMRQRGGFLLKFAASIFVLALLIVAGGIVYLGSAELPPPSATIHIPVPDNALQRQ